MPNIVMYQLPSNVVNKGRIKGDPLSNNEKYLLEFVNESKHFREKSQGDIYESPPKEDNCECDCIADNYSLDFKLLGSQSSLEASGMLSPVMTRTKGGVSISPSKSKQEQMEASRLHVLLRDRTLLELEDIYKNDLPPKKSAEYLENYDMKTALKVSVTKKNLLYFLTYFFTNKSNEICNEEEVIAYLEEGLSNCFKSLFQFRDKVCEFKYDTYISAIYEEWFMMFVWEKDKIKFLEKIRTEKSEVFSHLDKYTFPPRAYYKLIERDEA